jgi:hypothetical protein
MCGSFDLESPSLMLWMFTSCDESIVLGARNGSASRNGGKMCRYYIDTSIKTIFQSSFSYVFEAGSATCYDLRCTADITRRVGTLFIFSSCMFRRTFHYMFHPLFHLCFTCCFTSIQHPHDHFIQQHLYSYLPCFLLEFL